MLLSLWEFSQSLLVQQVVFESFFETQRLFGNDAARVFPQLVTVFQELFVAAGAMHTALVIRGSLMLILGVLLIGVGASKTSAVQSAVQWLGSRRFAFWLSLPFIAQALDLLGAFAFIYIASEGRLNENVNRMFALRERNQAITQLFLNGDPTLYLLQSLLVGSIVVIAFIVAIHLEKNRMIHGGWYRLIIILPTIAYLIGFASALMAIMLLR